MRQRIGAITTVVVGVHIAEEAAHVFAQRIIDGEERLAPATAMGFGLV